MAVPLAALFPITGRDIIPSYILGLALMSGVQDPLRAVLVICFLSANATAEAKAHKNS